jgi:hypothetical protein
MARHPGTSGDDEAGRIGQLDDLVRGASKEQPGQSADASPTKDYEIRTSQSGHIDDDACGVADLNHGFYARGSFLARDELRGMDDCAAELLEHFILGSLHMLHARKVCQFLSRSSAKDGGDSVQHDQFRAIALRNICGECGSLGQMRRSVDCDQDGFEGHGIRMTLAAQVGKFATGSMAPEHSVGAAYEGGAAPAGRIRN